MDGKIYKDEINNGEDERAIREELARAQENVTTKVKRSHVEPEPESVNDLEFEDNSELDLHIKEDGYNGQE